MLSSPAPSVPVAILPEKAQVIFTLADGSRHVARLVPSARARRLRLRLGPGGSLALTVPAGLTPRELPALLASFLPWLGKKLPACAPTPPPELPHQLDLPLRHDSLCVCHAGTLAEGRRRAMSSPEAPLLLRTGSKRLLALVHGHELQLHAADTPEDAALLLRRWCRRQAESLLPPFLLALARQGGFSLAHISIRDQRSRWGSCSRRDGGSINLNWRAVLLPLPLLEHLCWHELCHLRHMDHSPAYHAELARFSPDWRARERALGLFWRDLPPWARPGTPPR